MTSQQSHDQNQLPASFGMPAIHPHLSSIPAFTGEEYQRATEATDVRPDPKDPALPLLGLAGEVGRRVAGQLV